MYRFNTEEFTSQDDLSPEIRRRLQVEETWARRNVLAELMNIERFKVYARRRVDLAAGFAPMDVASRYKLSRRAATVVSLKHRRSFAPGNSAL
jgi:hypothetical protein